LTSLNCSHIHSLNSSHLLLIADCFPLLKELYLGYTFINNCADPLQSLLSKCLCIQHLDLRCTYFLNDQHVIEWSLFLADLVSINLSTCHSLTESALFSLVRSCHSLSDIKMEYTNIGKESVQNSDSLTDISVYPQLKSLYLGLNSWLSDENIIMFASIFPNLQHLDLSWCDRISEGICQVLKRCCKIRQLNLTGCPRVNLRGINFVVPQLEMLSLSDTKVDDETLYVISKNCCGLLKLLLKHCHNITEKGVKHVAENCTLLREIYLKQFLLSDINKELFSRRAVKIWIEK
jgi:F-box and leucine-rich repeat protein 2/20